MRTKITPINTYLKFVSSGSIGSVTPLTWYIGKSGDNECLDAVAAQNSAASRAEKKHSDDDIVVHFLLSICK